MNSDSEQVFTAALCLPEGERIELVEALIVSIQPPDQPPLDDSWREVIQRRSSELRSGQVTSIPWAEVKERARDWAGG